MRTHIKEKAFMKGKYIVYMYIYIYLKYAANNNNIVFESDNTLRCPDAVFYRISHRSLN